MQFTTWEIYMSSSMVFSNLKTKDLFQKCKKKTPKTFRTWGLFSEKAKGQMSQSQPHWPCWKYTACLERGYRSVKNFDVFDAIKFAKVQHNVGGGGFAVQRKHVTPEIPAELVWVKSAWLLWTIDVWNLHQTFTPVMTLRPSSEIHRF